MTCPTPRNYEVFFGFNKISYTLLFSWSHSEKIDTIFKAWHVNYSHGKETPTRTHRLEWMSQFHINCKLLYHFRVRFYHLLSVDFAITSSVSSVSSNCCWNPIDSGWIIVMIWQLYVAELFLIINRHSIYNQI